MSLSPIQIYEPRISPLTQILQQGNQTITGIFDKAVQIGRDLSNKQLQQEQDMLAMRNSETAMAQRRAEGLQQNWEDVFRGQENRRQFDIKFGADQTQREFQNDRVTAQDIFSNDMEQKRFGLAETGLDIRKQEADRKANVFEQEQKFNQGIINGGGAEPLPGEPQTVGQKFKAAATGFAGDFMNLITGGGGGGVKSEGGDAGALRGEIDVSTARLKALEGKDAAAYQAELRRRGQLEAQLAALGGKGGAGSPYAAKDQAMQEKTFADSQAAKADKAMEEKVLGNTAAFIPQESVMQKRAADAEKYKDPTKKPTGAEVVEAEAYDKNRYIAEKASAGRMTLPEYLAKGPQDAASKKAREELWNHVNLGGTKPSSAGAGPVSQIPGIGD